MEKYELPLGNPRESEVPVIIHVGYELGSARLAWPIVAAASFRSYRSPSYLVTLSLVGFFELRGEGETLEEALANLGDVLVDTISRESQVPVDELPEASRIRLRNLVRIIS